MYVCGYVCYGTFVYWVKCIEITLVISGKCSVNRNINSLVSYKSL